MTVYGIKNCDTVQKTLKWLQRHNIEFTYHDFREDGITRDKLDAWCDAAGWEVVLNKKSTTWREADKKEQAAVTTQKKAIDFLLQNTSGIKRPVIEVKGKWKAQGFNEETYKELFLK